MRARVSAAAAFALAATAALAEDERPLLGPGEKVRSSFVAAGERKTVAFAGVEGSKLTVEARRTKGSQVVPRLSVLRPDGVPIDVDDTNPGRGPRARVARLVLDTTGAWRIGVETGVGKGGAFELAATAKVPLRFAWKDSAADRVFAAAAGGTATVAVVAAKGSAPHVELIAPSGAVVGAADGVRGRAKLVAPLPELGRYVVRTTGVVGPSAAAVAVRPARRGRPTYRDVESRPEIRGFSPTTFGNDYLVRMQLDGFAFSTQQTVALVDGVAAKAAAAVLATNPDGAVVDLDLNDVPPGTYSIRVSTSEGNVAVAPGTVVVTNRPPGVATIEPREVTGAVPVPLDVRGIGFDAGARLFVRRTSDATEMPLSAVVQTGHGRFTATLTPPPYETGLHDIEVRDSDGGASVVAGAIDLLGYRQAPVVLPITAPGPNPENFAVHAAYDAAHGRVLLATTYAGGCAYLLVDATTFAVLDSTTVADVDLYRSGHPRVAWNARDGTFALSAQGHDGGVFVRVVSAQDVHAVVGKMRIAGAVADVMSVAADPDRGGYLAAWNEYDAATGVSKLKTRRFPGDEATFAAGVERTIASHPFGYVWQPVTERLAADRFVVAWMGSSNDDVDFAVHHTLVDAGGAQIPDNGPYTTATSRNWYDLFYPSLVPNPTDGSLLLGYTYLDADDVYTYRPACQRLAPVTAQPSAWQALDADSHLPEGYLSTMVWNPARNEFVVAMTTAVTESEPVAHVLVRRVGPDGAIHGVTVLESYDGDFGTLFAGPATGTLGLAVTSRPTRFDPYRVRVGLLR